MKVSEIAELIEVSPRMVKEYKNDLEKAGIYINSKQGRHGGYYLENTIDIRGMKIECI
ncbi:MAG: HTH domain-containing protein [Tissierellaceae bacterium]|nr:HTH domain-containing protein [Tissierellaceae bacterium]